jgi:hypothetical protein
MFGSFSAVREEQMRNTFFLEHRQCKALYQGRHGSTVWRLGHKRNFIINEVLLRISIKIRQSIEHST